MIFLSKCKVELWHWALRAGEGRDSHLELQHQHPPQLWTINSRSIFSFFFTYTTLGWNVTWRIMGDQSSNLFIHFGCVCPQIPTIHKILQGRFIGKKYPDTYKLQELLHLDVISINKAVLQISILMFCASKSWSFIISLRWNQTYSSKTLVGAIKYTTKCSAIWSPK